MLMMAGNASGLSDVACRFILVECRINKEMRVQTTLVDVAGNICQAFSPGVAAIRVARRVPPQGATQPQLERRSSCALCVAAAAHVLDQQRGALRRARRVGELRPHCGGVGPCHGMALQVDNFTALGRSTGWQVDRSSGRYTLAG
jgi:hypothetical protein